MKKLIAAGLIVLAFSATTTALASPDPSQTPQPAAINSSSMPSSVVDEIEIPYDVWIYAQTQYQGLAITHANKINRNGQVYRVRLDRDSIPENFSSSIYLFYDLKWQLIAEEKVFTPKEARVETKPSAKTEESASTQDEPVKPQATNQQRPTANDAKPPQNSPSAPTDNTAPTTDKPQSTTPDQT